MKLMRFQVLPLRVLATRKVMAERLDYKEHLAGFTRQELDDLDKLCGRFQRIGSEMVVERLDEEGEVLEEVARDKWEEVLWKSDKSSMLTVLEKQSKDVIIEEKKEEKRGWQLRNFNGDALHDTSNDREKTGCLYFHYDSYIEDGNLVWTVKIFYWEGLYDGPDAPLEESELEVFQWADAWASFSLDSEQILIWKSVYKRFHTNYKVTNSVKLKRVV